MAETRRSARAHNLIVVLGDQLDAHSAAFDGFDRQRDAVLMMEVAEEARYVPQHKQRLVLFFSAMRHFRKQLEKQRRTVNYSTLDDEHNSGALATEATRWAHLTRAERLIMVQPGDYRVLQSLRSACDASGLALEVREDRHFYTSSDGFADFAAGRRELMLEDFYRRMRREHDVLMDGKQPRGGRWNFDADNRESFGKDGPGAIPAPSRSKPDALTREVMALVQREFTQHPGRLDSFDHAVTPRQAKKALDDFVANRLPLFGRYQDAMVAGEPYLYHSLLSSSLNMHMLDPRALVQASIDALNAGRAPLNAVEGFVRQVLGWREYVRGVYWWKMPQYAQLNALRAELPMPAFMWSAETEMRCVRDGVQQLIDHAYTHHIQRLMVLGLFALLLGVRPYQVHQWHMTMYIDAIDWVSLPNVLGMSQYGDGGIVGTKPYCASGNYINRMGNYCSTCRYDPSKSSGDDACPFTTLYWDFLMRHKRTLQGNRRMGFQFRNLSRKTTAECRTIRKHADRIKVDFTRHTYL